MIRSRFVRSVALTLSVTFALSCASDITPTAPIAAPTAAQDGLIGDLLGVVTGLLGSVLKVIVGVVQPTDVYAVKWAPSHVNQVRSVSGYIGYGGGTLSIPGSDFTITFPRGGYVSYDMYPHGITFSTPVIVTQKLNNTTVYGTSKAWNSFGAYFPQDLLDLSGLLKASETTTTTIYSAPSGNLPAVQTWQLRHFSRYMLASG